MQRSLAYMKNFSYTITLFSMLWASSLYAAISESQTPYTDPVELYFSDDQMIEAATRYPKAISQVAENVVVITAEEIVASNARSVAEVLNRAAGMFVSFNGQDVGSSSSLHIQGSTSTHPHHTLVLLDGVRFNYISSGNAETNGIPLGIIKRIEVIKGPASSAWGSALGGVINIITKGTGKNAQPTGVIFGSRGKSQTGEINAEAAGLLGKSGYYLYAGKQDSGGLRDNRYFHNKSVYAKFHFPLGRKNELLLTGGLTGPEHKYFDYAPLDFRVVVESRDRFATATWNGEMSKNLIFSISSQIAFKKFNQTIDVLGVGIYGDAGDLFQNFLWQEKSLSTLGRFVWTQPHHTASIGFEYMRNELKQTIDNGLFLQGFGQPSQAVANPAKERKWGVYFNDTISLGKTTIIPGLRYDTHSITGSFLSPSLGGIYQWNDETLFRASIARGFSAPFLVQISGGGSAFGTINPDLNPEEVWSYQIGAESIAIPRLRIKTSVFLHDLEESWGRDNTGKPVNAGRDRRVGFEIEMETTPVHGFSTTVNYSSVFEKVYDSEVSDNLQAANASLIYIKPDSIRVELAGHYAWWQARETTNGQYNSPTWDWHIRKTLFTRQQKQLDVFLSIRNIFNGSQYWSELFINPDRSIDGGLRLSF